MKRKFKCIVFLICLVPFIAKSQSNKTQILILGTPHLQQIDGIEAPMLDKVITKLDSFDFDVICIEKMSGELLYDIQSRQDSAFDGITKGRFGAEFLSLADTVQAINGIAFLEAKKNVLKQVSEEKLTINERKELLFNLLATTDLPSAALQYEYINNKTVFATDFEKYIANIIEKKIASQNEYYSLAASLAKRENINQLESIDNLQDEALLFMYYPDFVQEYKDQDGPLDQINELPVYQKINRLSQEGVQANDLSNLYAFFNSNEYKQQDYSGQWEIWLKTNFPSGADRARYALWEMRNLQITANIMNVVARYPERKILVIIGASHGAFIEKYLEQVEHLEVLKYN